VTTDWEVKGEYVRTAVQHPFLNQTLEFDGYYFTLMMIFKRFKPYFSYQYSMLPESRLDDEQALPFNVLIETMVKKTGRPLVLSVTFWIIFMLNSNLTGIKKKPG